MKTGTESNRINPGTGFGLVSLVACLALAAGAVELSPCGDVRLGKVPTRALVQDANWAEMIEISGRPVTVWATRGARPEQNIFLARVPGWTPTNHVTFAADFANASVTGFAYDRELFHALRPDVIHIDPVQLSMARGWSRSAVDEVCRTVAPFFANRFSRDNHAPAGVSGYAFYTIPELALRMGALYGCEDRMRRLTAFIAEVERAVTNRLVGVARPRLALVMANAKGGLLPFRIGAGIGQTQYRVLGVRDAFDGMLVNDYAHRGPGMTSDLELLVAAKPDVVISPFSGSVPKTHTQYQQYLQLLRCAQNPAARAIPAFSRGRVFPGGTPLQGPVTYLFQLEMAAKEIYPEVFGVWREAGDYAAAECLFDRAALADMVK